VRGHQDGGTGGMNVLEDTQDFMRASGVEVSRGFVGEHDIGLIGHRAGDGDALLFSAGKFMGKATCLRPQLHQIQNLIDAMFDARFGHIGYA
jgi:hypothetical protein